MARKKIKKEEESCLKDAKITAKRVEETDTTNFLPFTVSGCVPLLDVDDCPNISTLQPPTFNFFWRILSFVAANLFELIKRGNKSFSCLQFVSFYRGGTKGWKGLFFLEWDESAFLSDLSVVTHRFSTYFVMTGVLLIRECFWLEAQFLSFSCKSSPETLSILGGDLIIAPIMIMDTL